jgi:iron complex outermembrane receptor protein
MSIRARHSAPLRRHPIALACSSLLLVTSVAQAQQAPAADAGQTVVVTGIRQSIESSIATKRNSDSIVEAIASEDLGKLPDSSIAEALSRLPGLTGQRGPDGRTSLISIRGLSPTFAGVLLNGREVVSSNDGRAVEFDQFPSELVGSVTVYKTPEATLSGQGLSGTMDIQTIRPLDLSGRQIAVNLRGERNSNGTMVPGVAPSTGSRFSISYVDQFADRTIGVALGYARLDAATQLKQFQLWDFAGMDQQWIDWGARVGGDLPRATNGGASALMPMGMEATAATKRNKRDGLMAVLEYKPNKDLNSRLDLYYSKFDTREVGRKFMTQTWAMWDGAERSPVINNAKTTEVGQNTIITSGTFSQMPTVLQNFETKRKDDIKAAGWNTTYKVGKQWTAELDVSMSKDVRDETYYENFTAPYANGAWTLGTYNFNVPTTAGVATFVPSQDFTSTTGMKMGDPFNWVPDDEDPGFAGNIRTPHITDDIKSVRVAGKYTFESGMFSKLDFGANYSKRDKKIQKNEVRLNLPADATGALMRDIPSYAVSGITPMTLAGIPGVLGLDVPALVRGGALVEQAVYWNKASNDSAVHEKVSTLYAKLAIDTEVMGLPLSGNLGLQAVHTKQNAEGWVWLGNNKAPDLKDLYAVTGGTSYWDYLPSLNLKLELPGTVMVRFGLAKTLARPEMNDMRAGASAPAVDVQAKPPAWGAGNSGNPALEPWRATATDLEVAKFMGKRSYVSLAGYHKRLTTTIYNEKVLRDFSGFPNYSGVTPISPYGFATGLANGKAGSMSGIEAAMSLDGGLFSKSLDGIGLVVSASKLHTSLKNNNGDDVTFDGSSGQSNNITAYYERDGLSARISQRYRSAYVAMERDWAFAPVFRRRPSEKLVDLQLGYAFESGPMKGLSLLLQVNNVTDEVAVTYKTPNHGAADMGAYLPNFISYFGRQVLFGVNYKL